MSQPKELARVRRAVRARERAETEYKLALLAARGAGYSLAQIAEAGGSSKENVFQILSRLEDAGT